MIHRKQFLQIGISTKAFAFAGFFVGAVFLCPSTMVAQSEKPPAPATQQQELRQRIWALSRKARQASSESAKEMTELIEECQALLKLKPEKPNHRRYLMILMAWSLDYRAQNRIQLSNQFREAGNIPQADLIEEQLLNDFALAIEMDPSRWQIRLHRGNYFAGNESYEEALEEYTAALKIEPNDTRTLFNRAEVNFQLRQFEAARKDYDAVIQKQPNDLAAISGRAHCWLELNNVDAAFQDYNQVVMSSPNDPWALANRSDALLAGSKWKSALADLEKAMSLQTNAEIVRRSAWLLATCPDETICDGSRAVQLAERAIELGGRSITNLDTLAAALAADGKFDKARDIHTQVIAMSIDEDPKSQIKQAAYEKNERYQEKFAR